MARTRFRRAVQSIIKIETLIALLFAVFAFAACGKHNGTESSPPENSTEILSPTDKTENQPPATDSKEITDMYLYINDNKIEVTLVKNSSVDALVEILKKGDIVYTADDYGGFEKVGGLGRTLPRNDEPIDTSAGDVILYQGNSLCLYYGDNSWTFTRIGKINGYTVSELRTLLCAGNGSVQIRICLK